jgi:hypothetical protein
MDGINRAWRWNSTLELEETCPSRRCTGDDPEIRRVVATVVAAEQVRLLQANGVDEFHF